MSYDSRQEEGLSKVSWKASPNPSPPVIPPDYRSALLNYCACMYVCMYVTSQLSLTIHMASTSLILPPPSCQSSSSLPFLLAGGFAPHMCTPWGGGLLSGGDDLLRRWRHVQATFFGLACYFLEAGFTRLGLIAVL